MTVHRCLHCAIRDAIEAHAAEHLPRDAAGDPLVNAGAALVALAHAAADLVTMPGEPLMQSGALQFFMTALSRAITERGLPTDFNIAAVPVERPSSGLH